MGKNNKKKTLPQPQPTPNRPLVSLCTPTFNRRPFIQSMITCIQNQTYPKECMEWIIVDDGTDKIGELLENVPNVPKIHYYPVQDKMTLGAKRNYTHCRTNGSILVYIDDDDYYPPERVEHAVDTLLKNANALCAGSSEIYVYFKHIQQMYQGGPYGPNHATAGTFAFRKELLNQTQYNPSASLAEEREFLKNYTIPFVQLDPMKTILVFSHNHNTFDKKKLLKDDNPTFKPSTKTVDEFIRQQYEKPVKDFFMEKIDSLLETYKPGEPTMKPDVLEQMKVLEAQREQMRSKNMQIMVQENGKPQRPMTMPEVAEILKKQQQEIQVLKQHLHSFQSGKNPLQDTVEDQGRKIGVLEGLNTKMKAQLLEWKAKAELLEKEKNTNTNTVEEIGVVLADASVQASIEDNLPNIQVPIPSTVPPVSTAEYIYPVLCKSTPEVPVVIVES
jgi:cellulose synthase/poly-beta-1,6-N-acetylglucosamine synthase-like glycosyltransferase